MDCDEDLIKEVSLQIFFHCLIYDVKRCGKCVKSAAHLFMFNRPLLEISYISQKCSETRERRCEAVVLTDMSMLTVNVSAKLTLVFLQSPLVEGKARLKLLTILFRHSQLFINVQETLWSWSDIQKVQIYQKHKTGSVFVA